MLQIILASSLAIFSTLGLFFIHLPVVAFILKFSAPIGAIWAGYSIFKKIQTVIRLAKLTKAGVDAIKSKVEAQKKA